MSTMSIVILVFCLAGIALVAGALIFRKNGPKITSTITSEVAKVKSIPSRVKDTVTKVENDVKNG